MGLTIDPGVSIGPGVDLIIPIMPVAPNGLTAEQASTSAWQIKQDYPASTDGVYWIQNANINGGDPVEIYADMTTDGGGWTLILQNVLGNWNYDNCLLRNQATPPTALGSANYSIIGWADYIKRSASGFEYMLEAGARNTNGGIFTANEAYSFIDQVDLVALAAQGVGIYFGGPSQELYTGSQGFRQNVTLTTKFGNWNFINDGLERRMPWFTTNSPGISGDAILTTSNADSGSWWGTLMTYNADWSPAPWNEVSNNPGVIWYWVR